MNLANFSAIEPGFVFDVNDKNGQIVFYITTANPIFFAAPDFTPAQITEALLTNVSQGDPGKFYEKISKKKIARPKQRELEKKLKQLIPQQGSFFISTQNLLEFISNNLLGVETGINLQEINA
jgi:hypothetical protein